jgi:hypothetical protein
MGEMKPPMTITTTVPIDNLTERIAQQQLELEILRKELGARQTRVAKLNERKDELDQRLRQLDAEIEAVRQGKTPPRRPGKPPAATSAAQESPVTATPPKKMADLLVEIVGDAKGPLTAKHLADELQGRGFYTDSPNLPRIVQARLYELVGKRILRRADGQAGVILGNNGKAASKALAAKTGTTNKAGKKTSSSRVGADGQAKAPLRALVTEVLAKSQQPLAARALAEQVKAQGYKTKSKDLTNVMWAMLGKMDNVENVPGEGYRLKKR